eukprot:TRINITY_DN2341_c0_g1_i1.p1 TRINITY_DN2341_c0_g1~~TRINITY_DN2341_c0_g1_i1.p1  ORF type:complete len:378 (-),score=124.74 TRINITY_DN2341_c0_g1_i1:24-1157(-)
MDKTFGAMKELAALISPDDPFWSSVLPLFNYKINEMHLYNHHLSRYDSERNVLEPPANGLFAVLPTELTQFILSFISISDLSLNIRRVCHMMTEITSKGNTSFWKEILTKRWDDLTKQYRPIEMKDIEYGIVKGGGYYIATKGLVLDEMEQKYGTIKERARWGMIRGENGWVYAGGYNKGSGHGLGIMRYDNGITYEGEWKRGKKEGMGVYKDPKGYMYNGEWKNGGRDGRGVETLTDGSVYEGEWRNNTKEGRGMLTLSNGCMYDGEWKNGRREGRGIYRWASGNVYDGEWKDNKREGRGVKTTTSGGMYEGEFKNGKKEGRGMFRFPNGCVFEGEWKSNKIEGVGVYRWPDGKCYEGEWNDDITWLARIDGVING